MELSGLCTLNNGTATLSAQEIHHTYYGAPVTTSHVLLYASCTHTTTYSMQPLCTSTYRGTLTYAGQPRGGGGRDSWLQKVKQEPCRGHLLIHSKYKYS